MPIPYEYIEYRMCREFHCLPADLEHIDQDTIELFQEFMRIEAEATTMRPSPSANE